MSLSIRNSVPSSLSSPPNQHHGRHCLHIETMENRILLHGSGDYRFEVLKTVGESVPDDGGYFVSNFQVSGFNDRGQVTVGGALGTTPDPDSAFGEGVVLLSEHDEKLLARAGDPAPGGGTYSLFFLGEVAINNKGDVGFPFELEPETFPVGVNSGLFRYSARHDEVQPVVIPDVTAAPDNDEPFAGVFFGANLNDRGRLAFNGIVTTDDGIHVPDEEYTGVGVGTFVASARGRISPLVVPGDAAPGGGTFDLTSDVHINNRGDAVFMGHVAGECEQFVPQEIIANCFDTGLYVRNARSGRIKAIVEAGDDAPGNATFHGAGSPVINDRGDIAFAGGLTSAVPRDVLGVYLYRGGRIIDIASPGDVMPGGGTFVSGSEVGGGQIDVNNKGQVAFNAKLDPGDGSQETGLYTWQRGDVDLVVKTGSEIPGIGTIAQLATATPVIPAPPDDFFTPDSSAYINERGQIAFSATLTDGRVVVIVATADRRHGRFDGFRHAVAAVAADQAFQNDAENPDADRHDEIGRGRRVELSLEQVETVFLADSPQLANSGGKFGGDTDDGLFTEFDELPELFDRPL